MAEKTVELADGSEIPLLLFGTFRIRGYDVIESCLDAALASGYRGIDTAGVYRNEHEIGQALRNVLLKKHGLERKDIYVTSKLAPNYHGAEEARKACSQSVGKLNLDYIDLYLIHWPGTQGVKHNDPKNRMNRKQSWLALEQLQKEGKIRALGVSNYTIAHMEELLEYATVKPVVLQVEMHPFLTQEPLKQFCNKHGIHLQAYSSLGTTDHHDELLRNDIVLKVAQREGHSASQCLLRWAVQQKVSVLPKSINTEHIAENSQIFDWSLSEESVKELSSLNRNRHFCWDPNTIL